MHILFDNGTPRQLRHQLFGHEVETARQRGWETLANGTLLDQAQAAGFEIIITTDQKSAISRICRTGESLWLFRCKRRGRSYNDKWKPSATRWTAFSPARSER